MKRRCRVCGAVYEYCYSCEKVHSWRALTDTADHYYVLNVLMEYQVDHDAMKAYQAFCRRSIDIHDTVGFLPNVQTLLDEIACAVKAVDKKKTVPLPHRAAVQKKAAASREMKDAADKTE